MAVNLLARLSNLWGGFVSLWIADVEKNHPEIAYENSINSMVEKYSRLKSATAAIIRRREEIDARVTSERAELDEITAAVTQGLGHVHWRAALQISGINESIEATFGEWFHRGHRSKAASATRPFPRSIPAGRRPEVAR